MASTIIGGCCLPKSAEEIAALQDLSNEESGREVAILLRKEVLALVKEGVIRERVISIEQDYEAEFPRLDAGLGKRRIRATSLSVRPREGDILAAPNFDGDMRSTLGSSSTIFAAANATPPINPEPKPRINLMTPKKKSLEAIEVPIENEEDFKVARALGLLFADIAQRGGSSALALAPCIETLCTAATVDTEARLTQNIYLNNGRQCRAFAVSGLTKLHSLVYALAGRAALEKLGPFDNFFREVESYFFSHTDKDEETAVRDLSLPFEAATDSRHAWEADAAARRAYNNREKTRDAFLRLLRDFETASLAVDGRDLQALLPPDDEIFLFKECRQRIANIRKVNNKKSHVSTHQTLRLRATEIVRSVLPENIQWFAILIDATLMKASTGKTNEKHRKLEARFFENEQETRRLEKCVGSHNSIEKFFYLFLKAADAAALEASVITSLTNGIFLELSSSIDLHRLGVRARLAGLLLADCIPLEIQAQRPWPPALCPVHILDSLLERSATPDDRFRIYARVFLVASLCKPLQWEDAFLKPIKQSYIYTVRTAIVSARQQVEALSSKRSASSALLAARLELDALVYNELQLSEADNTHLLEMTHQQNTLMPTPAKTYMGTPDVGTSKSLPTPLHTALSSSSPAGRDDIMIAEHDFNLGRTAVRASRPARNLGSVLSAALCRDHAPAVLTRLDSGTKKQKLRPYLLTKPNDTTSASIQQQQQQKDAAELTANQRARFAPLVSSFFKRYPTIQAAIDLAIQVTRSYAEAEYEGDLNSLLLERLQPALKLALPPNAPDRVLSLAMNLATERFRYDVIPNIVVISKRPGSEVIFKTSLM